MKSSKKEIGLLGLRVAGDAGLDPVGFVFVNHPAIGGLVVGGPKRGYLHGKGLVAGFHCLLRGFARILHTGFCRLVAQGAGRGLADALFGGLNIGHSGRVR